MATYTDNYQLTKPLYSETADVAAINNNMDKIDDIMHASQVSLAPAYDQFETYNTGDVVMYEFLMYECLEDEVTGAWDATKWQRTTAGEHGGGGGGSDVSITPTLQSGTKIADYEIDGVSGALYAPSGGGGGTIDGSEYSDAKIANLPYIKYNKSLNTDGKYLDSNGAEQTYSGWSITDYLIIADNPVYYMPTGVSGNNVKSCLYDKNKTFISSFSTPYAGDNSLIAPSNAKYVRFSVKAADVNDFDYTSQLLLDIVRPTNIEGSVKTEDFKDYIVTGEYYNDSGTTSSGSAWARSRDVYPVNAGDVIYASPTFGLSIVEYDENMNVTRLDNTPASASNITVSAKSDTKYIGINILQTNLSTYVCTVNGTILGSKYKISWLDAGSENGGRSIWRLKNYISHGDSITWQDGKQWQSGPDQGTVAKGYQTIFSEKVTLSSVTNKGKSGWAMAIVNGNGVVNEVLNIQDYTIYDLCTISCGTNDFKLNVPLGTKGIIGDTTFDDTTFYGAYRKSIEYILNNSPTIRLVLMTPLQRDSSGYDVNYTNSAGFKLIDYSNAVKELGEMYGLPVCDMYSNSGFTKKTLATYTLDGLHPNSAGYIRMGNLLTGFLETVGC